MEVQDLNKSQLILLAILLSFITSIATGITTVTLMQQAPESVTVPITRIVRQTVEKISPEMTTTTEVLSSDQKKLLEDLKSIKPLTVTLIVKRGDIETNLGTGLFLGDNRVVIASTIEEEKEGDIYILKSILGEQTVSKVTREKDFTIVEVENKEVTPVAPINPVPTNTETNTDTNDSSSVESPVQ